MIRETIKIHDKFQFEVKMSYELSHEKKTTFDIDSYFFIPNSLGINKDSYSKSDFFKDMQVYIRFKTPSLLLEECGRVDHDVNRNLRKTIEKMVASRSENECHEYENQLKMYCCIFKAALRDHVDYLYARKTVQDEEILVEKFLREIGNVTTFFRSLRSIVSIPNLDTKLFSTFLFSDEYISLLIEQYSFKIIHILNTRTTDHEKHVSKLKQLIKAENEYRKENGYPSIVKTNENNEIYLYRSSVLKKFMGSILFLTVQRQSEDKILEHLLYAIAAGISMVVATGIAFYSQIRLGNLTFPFFVALVISYMFKDRIKVIFQQFFSNQIRKYFYDQKERIFYNPKETIGVCKESVDFFDSKLVPANIQKIRNCDHMTEIENGWVGQNVIRYRRSIDLHPPMIRKTFQNLPVQTVNDIIRFNVSRFLLKMDDPRRLLYCLAEDEIKRIPAERAYHINLVMVFSIKNKSTFYKRFRIILNREGINRLEEIPVGLLDENKLLR